jgi:hypothetical protein
VNAQQMRRALLPVRALLVAMCNRNTIAVPAAARLPRRSALHGETADRLPSAPPRGRRSASVQGERDD